MEKNILILSIITLVGIFGLILFQINMSGNAFLAQLGFILTALSVIVGISVGMLYK